MYDPVQGNFVTTNSNTTSANGAANITIEYINGGLISA